MGGAASAEWPERAAAGGRSAGVGHDWGVKTINSRAMCVALAGAAGLAILGAGGCAAPLERGMGGEPDVEMCEGSAGGWQLVLNSPMTTRALRGTDPRELAEYGRNDGALAYRVEGPVLANDEWPERERPDLFYARRVQLERRADEILYFDRESRYWGGSRRGYWGGDQGTWGFWR